MSAGDRTRRAGDGTDRPRRHPRRWPRLHTAFIPAIDVSSGFVGIGADPRTGQTRVARAGLVKVDGATFRVSSWELIPGTEISSNSTIWANTPDRLLLVMCLQNVDGSTDSQSLVIEASCA